MTEFICRIGTQSGEIVTRTVEAESEADLRLRLQEDGFKVFSVKSVGGGLLRTGVLGGAGKSKINQGDFLLFNQQLSALLRAGIPILQAVSLLRERAASSSLRQVLTDVETKIKSGVPLSEAFEAQGIFSRMYTASILAGESSGALDDVLSRYVIYLKRSVGITRKIRGAVAYPAFLLVAASLMVAFLTLYIIPRMSDLFKGLNTRESLPTVTLVVLGISSTLADNIWWVLPVSIVGIFVLVLWLRTPGGRLTFDGFLLKLPFIGDLIRQLASAQLCRSLSTLLSGGITVPEAWEIGAQSIGNTELRRRSAAVLAKIREGRGFSESVASAAWLPALAVDMIGIGEKSGSLREMLDEVANFYDAESEVRLEQLMSLLEPVILVVMALIVVAILLAIYLPIIQTISAGPFTGR
jgi:type IV pilus assembly protein PilC